MKSNHNINLILFVFLAIIIFNPLSIFAKETTSTDLIPENYQKLEQAKDPDGFISLYEYNNIFNHPEMNPKNFFITPRAAGKTVVKQETKPIITSPSGVKIGYLTLKYTSYFDGRPKFVIDKLYASPPPPKGPNPQFGPYIFIDTWTSYSPDNASVTIVYQLAGTNIREQATVNFLPKYP